MWGMSSSRDVSHPRGAVDGGLLSPVTARRHRFEVQVLTGGNGGGGGRCRYAVTLAAFADCLVFDFAENFPSKTLSLEGHVLEMRRSGVLRKWL